MCERSKTEILARELCMVNYTALKSVGYSTLTMSDYVDKRWKLFLYRSNRILETLEKHK